MAYTPYEEQNWDTTSYVNPTSMNHMENGIKSNSDGINALNSSLTKYLTVNAPTNELSGSSDFDTVTDLGEYGLVAYASNLTHAPSAISAYGAVICRMKLTVYYVGTNATKSLCQHLESINQNTGEYLEFKRIQIAGQWRAWV